jgi:hypothetical protein
VPEEPLTAAERAMPVFPFKQPDAQPDASDDVAPQPIQPPPPTTMPPIPPQATIPSVWPPATRPARSAADRVYRRHLMALAAAVMNRMAESDVLAHELAIRAGCPADTIDALLTGKPGELTLDGLEGILEKLGMILVLQMRPFGQQPGSQPIAEPGA